MKKSSVKPIKQTQYLYTACLNVRTLLQDNRISELEHAIANLKWDIIGLSEVRRPDEKIEEYEDFVLYHSHATNGRNGVGFLIKKPWKNKISSFKTFSDRVAAMEIQISDETVWSFVQIYAPTESYKSEDVEIFYQTVENALDFVNTKNLILMGDFNAQIGKVRVGEETVIGKFSDGKRSNNGQKLLEFALENNLMLINSMFKRKTQKRWTWRSPNGKHFNEIDYILTNQPTFIHSFNILNNLNFETDHRMLRCKIEINAQRKRKFIKNNHKHTKNLPILSRADGLHWENSFIEAVNISTKVQDQYNDFELKMKDLLKQLPKMDENRKQFTAHIKTLFEYRKQLYREIRTKSVKEKITEISKEINKNISKERKMRRQEVLERHLEKSGAIRKAYKEHRNKKEWTESLKNKAGNIISKRPGIIKEASNYYRDLYASGESQDSPRHTLQFSECRSTPDILKSEIEQAIGSQKSDKTPGEDSITNEVLKSLSEPLQAPLQVLFNNILETGEIPQQWFNSTIILLHKKGDRKDLGNYRPISLMSNMYKIFSKILLNRLSVPLDEQQPYEQAGFRKGYSTLDHIHVVTQVIEKIKEYRKTLYICFIDYKKAFDSIKHGAIWHSLLQQGVEKKYITLLHNIYSNSCAKVRLEREGDQFPIEKGVRQGDPLSPKVFSAVLESIFRNLDWEGRGLKVDGDYLSHLRFADDIVLFAENPTDLEIRLKELTRESKNVGLTLNTEKTKILTNGDRKIISIDGNSIEYVEEYIYLGQMVSFNECASNEIRRRISLAWKRYWSYKEIMKNKQIKIHLKKKLYEVAILPCLTYGCQTWSLKKHDENVLAICQRKMERSMMGIKQKERINNKIIRQKTKLVDVVKRIRLLKWNWAGHVCRLENGRWTKKVTEWIPRDQSRSRGRPRKRWEDIFWEKGGPGWMTKARDRNQWKEMGEAYAKEATTA